MEKAYRNLDAFDRAILRIIQRDNKMPQRQIAEAVHLSAAAVQRRIAAMEKSGIIIRNQAVIDARSVQMTITAIVEVHLINERMDIVNNAKRLFHNAPEVQQCYYVTGGISFVLIMLLPDITAYEATTRRLFSDNDDIASFRTLIVLDRIKTGSEIIIP
ncbi:MAG: Lrp/AsnC family transcriptional regulator [Zymomonas mobilis]|uniref:Lrp/AsnC family transcriptional regulator n=1 Tax=Zymomonas mobilis TaxID=542 RepID=UPI0039E92AA6